MDQNIFFEELTKASNMTDFFHRYIIHGVPYVFENEFEYYDFRKSIAEKFSINYFEVYIVGSAKLGFSYHKKTRFTRESDIDVVLLNKDLFDKYSQEVTLFQYGIENGQVVLSIEEQKKYEQFKNYLIKGWLRPDKLPTKLSLKFLKKEWFEFFKSISYGHGNVGDYKVAGGLFRDLYSLEKYYEMGLRLTQKKEERVSANE